VDDTLRDTVDYVAITRLQNAYADAVTRRAWSEFHHLFLPDAPIRVDTVTNPALDFIGRFLPGPVTVILESRSSIPELLTGGTGRIGVRIPAHDLALRIIRAFDSPITATSANISGESDPASPEEIRVPYDLLVDAGALSGIPSTVVDLVEGRILRSGESAQEIGEFLRVRAGKGA